MNVSDFGFDLPAELIAQAPAAERGASQAARAASSERARRAFAQCHDSRSYFREGDLLVVNDTKVFPARLLGARVPSGGAVECLLLLSDDARREGRWDALVHPGQKLQPGAQHDLSRHRVTCFMEKCSIAISTAGAPSGCGRMHGASVEDAIDDIGHVPLPPYIKRDDTTSDRERYQTVYARERGSVAAPTAGLHFTPEILEHAAKRGVERTAITLHVGYGTFQPVRVDQVEAHTLDAERVLDQRGCG